MIENAQTDRATEEGGAKVGLFCPIVEHSLHSRSMNVFASLV